MNERNELVEPPLPSADTSCKLTRANNGSRHNYPAIDRLAKLGLALTVLGFLVSWFGDSSCWTLFVVLSWAGFITSVVARFRRKTRLGRWGVIAGLALLFHMSELDYCRRHAKESTKTLSYQDVLEMVRDSQSKSPHTKALALPEGDDGTVTPGGFEPPETLPLD
jgi:hypothetical protein